MFGRARRGLTCLLDLDDASGNRLCGDCFDCKCSPGTYFLQTVLYAAVSSNMLRLRWILVALGIVARTRSRCVSTTQQQYALVFCI